MSDIPQAFEDLLEAEEQSDIVLLLTLHTTPAIRKLKHWHGSLTFDGNTFTPDDFEFGVVEAGVKGARPGTILTLYNIEDDDGSPLPWSTFLNANRIGDTRVSIQIIAQSLISDPTAVISLPDWYASGWEHDESTGQLRVNLRAPTDPQNFKTPRLPLAGDT